MYENLELNIHFFILLSFNAKGELAISKRCFSSNVQYYLLDTSVGEQSELK